MEDFQINWQAYINPNITKEKFDELYTLFFWNVVSDKKKFYSALMKKLCKNKAEFETLLLDVGLDENEVLQVTLDKLLRITKSDFKDYKHWYDYLVKVGFRYILRKIREFERKKTIRLDSTSADEKLFDEEEYDERTGTIIARGDYIKAEKVLGYRKKFERYKKATQLGDRNCYSFLKTLLENSDEYEENGYNNLMHHFDLKLGSTEKQREDALRRRKSDCIKKFQVFLLTDI